jgi:hypothetical protein
VTDECPLPHAASFIPRAIGCVQPPVLPVCAIWWREFCSRSPDRMCVPPCSPQALLASTSTASTIRASGQQLRAASDSFGSHGAILCMRLCVLWLIMCLACQQFVHTRAWLLGCADRLRSGPAIRVCVVEVRRSAWDSCQRVRGAAGTIAPCGAERTSTRALVGPASVGIRFVRTLLPI